MEHGTNNVMQDFAGYDVYKILQSAETETGTTILFEMADHDPILLKLLNELNIQRPEGIH